MSVDAQGVVWGIGRKLLNRVFVSAYREIEPVDISIGGQIASHGDTGPIVDHDIADIDRRCSDAAGVVRRFGKFANQG